jgi:hypothetical protein
MKIEVLYIRDCPNYGPVIESIRKILRERQLSQEIEEVEVRDGSQAVSLAFPGSPTVRVNGADVERELPKLNSYGLSCRTYLSDGKRHGIPTEDMIRTAIVNAQGPVDVPIARGEVHNLADTPDADSA